MKNVVITTICVLLGAAVFVGTVQFCRAANTVVIKPPIEVKPVDKEAEVIQRIAEIQADKEKLATTVYSGTMSQILTERVEDVNAVYVKAKQVIDDADAVLKEKGVIVSKRELVVSLLQKNSGKIKGQKDNAQFLKDITESLDPSTLDANDPNYISQVEQNADLIKWVTEIIQPI